MLSAQSNATTRPLASCRSRVRGLEAVDVPAADVVQEGELGVHQAGQEGDLPGEIRAQSVLASGTTSVSEKSGDQVKKTPRTCSDSVLLW